LAENREAQFDVLSGRPLPERVARIRVVHNQIAVLEFGQPRLNGLEAGDAHLGRHFFPARLVQDLQALFAGDMPIKVASCIGQ
jgi:hypothetical protein